jgi:hypothetical protein
LGTYFSFYAFLWRDIKTDVTGFTKYQMEGMISPTTTTKTTPNAISVGNQCKSNEYYCVGGGNIKNNCVCQSEPCPSGFCNS